MKASPQSPETSDTEATFHTPSRNHPLWTEGSVGSALQIIGGRRPTFVTHRIERTHSLFSNSLQDDSLDCPSYIVDLHFRSLVKYRQESQIPPPTWRGPPKQEGSHISPQDFPIHIQLPQLVTDTYKLVYMSCISKTACFLVKCISLFPPVWTERGAETTRSCLVRQSLIIANRTLPTMMNRAQFGA